MAHGMGVGTKKILVWISKDLRGAKWAGASSLPKKLCGKIGVGGRHRPGGGIAQGGGIAKKKNTKTMGLHCNLLQLVS